MAPKRKTKKSKKKAKGQKTRHEAEATGEQGEKPFRFLDLPAELRIRVYGLVLEAPHDLAILMCSYNWSHHPRHLVQRGAKLATNLLTACKAIKEEATPALYAHNCFKFRHTEYLSLFMSQIVATSTDLLRRIHICTATIGYMPDALKSFLFRQRDNTKFEELTFCNDIASQQCCLDPPFVGLPPQYFADVFRDFMEHLHRAQMRDTEHKPRNVLEVLQFRIEFDKYGGLIAEGYPERGRKNYKKYEADVKALLEKRLEKFKL